MQTPAPVHTSGPFPAGRRPAIPQAALVAALAGVAGVGVLTPGAGAQGYNIDVIAETGNQYVFNGTPYDIYTLGLPSISGPISGGWNLAVRGPHVLTYTSPGTPQAVYPASGGSLPSAMFNSAAHHDPNVGVYSGNTLLCQFDPSAFWFQRPSAAGALVANVEDDPLTTRIVIHGPSGCTELVSTDRGPGDFGWFGHGGGPSPDGGVSFGRGGGRNVVFRGHGSGASFNGIFARDYRGAPYPMVTVADNTMLNPATGGNFTFAYGTAHEHLPVAHGEGAAWTDATNSNRALLERPFLSVLPRVVSPIPPSGTDPGTPPGVYGNVSSGGAGFLAYEFTPIVPPGFPPADKVIKSNLMGVETDAVREEWITRRTVLGVSMGSEAVRRNPYAFSNPSGGGYTLAFHAYQYNPHTINAVYIRTIDRTGVDLGGMFGGDTLAGHFAGEAGMFSIAGGGSTGESPEGDFLEVLPYNDQSAVLTQEYGLGLGVGSLNDPSFNINSSEGVSFDTDYDMIVDGVTFMGLDPGEPVRFLLDNVPVMETIFEGNTVSVMEGLQYIGLDSLLVPAGSTFTVQHGGGADDGFRLSSLILGVVSDGQGCGDDTLTQSTDPSTVGDQSVWCGNLDISSGTSVARAFTASDTADLRCVTFGVSECSGGDWPVFVRVLEGSPNDPYGSLTLLSESEHVIPDGAESRLFTFEAPPATLVAGADYIVELFTPSRFVGDGGDGGLITLGFNNLGQSAPTYFRSPDCDVYDFVTLQSIGFGNRHLVLSLGLGAVDTPCIADLAEPYGLLDLFDISTFISGFVSADLIADLNGDGILDLSDVVDFVDSFTTGCP
jgi:hypothetical protein